VWLLPVVALVQLSLRQPVVADHGWHLPEPSQVPALLQSPAAGLLAAQRPLESEVPAGTLAQVPGGVVEVPLHVLHKPPVVASAQALLQQTPSVQKPLWHWLALEQVAPFTLRPQEPFTQVAGGTQSLASVADVQLILQAPFSQTKPPHDWFEGVVQAPLPSQVETGVTDEDGAGGVAATQAEDLQRTPVSTNAHAPLRHAPVVPHVEDSVVEHLPCGSGAPSGTALHNPAELAKLHAIHAPVQAPSQHTPWAQKPDWHSLLSLQSVPFGLSPQELLRQKLPSVHCESPVHEPKHALPLQR
jgi:hypothetical protein